MELSVQNVYGLLLRSRLMALDDARAMFQRWEREAKGAANNPAQFARWMVANHYVTEYQAQLLARGHADGFYLGHYKVLERLGKGRMAGVYKAVHHLGQPVAIKVLPPSKARVTRALRRFQREARLALRLQHPNIVRTYHVGEVNGLYFLVMEFIEGETLDDVLQRRGKLPPPEAVRLIYLALLGLQHMHEAGLVHRDLKPSNLMLSPPPASFQPETTLRSTVKILDIGLARALNDDSLTVRRDDPHLTREGVILGTPDYLAPEQARSPRSTDVRGDVYSLGCVLYHALAGQPPFPDTNIISQMIRHATEEPRPLRELNPAVGDGLWQVIGRMLAKRPAERYATPQEAAQALQAFLVPGGVQQAAPDAEAKLRSFLTWVATDGPKPPAVGRRRGDSKERRSSVAARPAPAAPAAPAAKASPGKRRVRKSKERPAAFDVELVAAPAPPAKPAGLRFGRRDFVVFSLGVLGTVAAVAAGLWAAREFPDWARQTDEPEPPSDDGAGGQGE